MFRRGRLDNENLGPYHDTTDEPAVTVKKNSSYLDADVLTD